MGGRDVGLNEDITNDTASGAPFNLDLIKFLMLRMYLNKAVSYTKPTNSHALPFPINRIDGGRERAWSGQIYHYLADRKYRVALEAG